MKILKTMLKQRAGAKRGLGQPRSEPNHEPNQEKEFGHANCVDDGRAKFREKIECWFTRDHFTRPAGLGDCASKLDSSLTKEEMTLNASPY